MSQKTNQHTVRQIISNRALQIEPSFTVNYHILHMHHDLRKAIEESFALQKHHDVEITMTVKQLQPCPKRPQAAPTEDECDNCDQWNTCPYKR